MMTTIKLVYYEISIYDSEENEYYKLGKIKNKNPINPSEQKYLNLTAILNEFYSEGKRIVIEDKKKGLRIRQWNEDPEGTIKGLIDYGEFGKQQGTWDSEQKEEDGIIKARTIVDNPFFFLFRIFPNERKGLLIVQTKGREGIKTALTDSINKKLEDSKVDGPWNCSHIQMKVETVSPGKIVKEVLKKGNVNTIKLKQNKASTDIFGKDKKLVGDIKISIEFEGETLTPEQLIEYLDDGPITFGDLKSENAIFDATLENENHKSIRTNIGKLSSSFDVTKDIKYIPETNHPTFKSIYGLAEKKAKEYYSKLWNGE